MDEQTREAHRRIFEKSLATFPAPTAEKTGAEFPADCYRLKDDPGHYFLIAFAPPGSFPEYVTPCDDSLTAVVMHGTDSTLPGEILRSLLYVIAKTGNFPRDNVRRLRNRPYESYLELGSGSEGSADNCTVINDAVDGTTVFIRAYNTSVFRGRLACLK